MIEHFIIIVLAGGLFWRYRQERRLRTELDGLKSRQRRQAARERYEGRLLTMGELVRDIAHQWRQPLNEINTELMRIEIAYLKDRLDHAELEARLERIETITGSMSETIEIFRDYFRVEEGAGAFDVAETIEQALRYLTFSLEHHGIGHTVQCDAPLALHGVQSALLQVLVIILSNAVDALKGQRDPSPRITIRCRHDALVIGNNGPTIAAADLPRIFDAHFTTKPLDRSGYGLFLARELIGERFGGEIHAENRPEGVEFSLTFRESHI